MTNIVAFVPRFPAPKARGPLETIEGKGVRIPIYSAPYRDTEGFMLAYYAEGVRKRERAPSLDAARRRAKELIAELTSGTTHFVAFSARETAAIIEAVEMLRPLGVTITEAVRQFSEAHRRLDGRGGIQDAVDSYLKHREEDQRPSIAVPQLVAMLLADLKEKQKSRRYVLDMQARLNTAAKAFPGPVGLVRAPQIDAWLSSLKGVSGRTKNNYRTALITLFSFARQKGYLARGQETEAEFSARYSDKGGEIGIYTPGQFNAFLHGVEPRFVPFVAIAGFAGLRSAEIVRLEWPEIRFGQQVIEVKAAKAKTASRRLVPIHPTLAMWLEPVRRKEGRVLHGVLDEFALAKQFRRAVLALNEASGAPVLRIVHNGFRHSYITYRMAALKNAAEVALEAGNSPRMIFEHYRELATGEQAKAWFALSPTTERVAGLRKWAESLEEAVVEPATTQVSVSRKRTRQRAVKRR